MLKIKLAGYNVDADVLNEMIAKDPSRNDVTPETLSAAYARISRDPRPVDELRKISRAEVEKARKTNKKIIFQMGHHSVAEHAVFNFDVLGISRLAMEELEKFRLCSFTEKSQRYITLQDAYVIPQEIKNTPHEKTFSEMVQRQFRMYDTLFNALKRFVFEKNSDLASDPKKHTLLEGWAKEDARYITPLATEAQLGLTLNARNLELVMRRFASNPLKEVQTMGRTFYELVEHIAPSIILFHQANDLDMKTYAELKTYVHAAEGSSIHEKHDQSSALLELVYHTPDADDLILCGLCHTVSHAGIQEIKKVIDDMDISRKKALFMQAFKYLEFYDSPPREFEYADLIFQLTITAACFGQLKRHRMATITAQMYNPVLGVVVPESIKKIGLEKEFLAVIEETNKVYEELLREVPLAAPYILTNAHRKRILIKMNARGLYHMSRLREDVHAQWEIRQTVRKMCDKAKEVMPLTMLLIGGKDVYPEIYKKVFGTYPKILPPEESIKNKVEITQ